ncbi:hypothetical protein [Yimella sp. cx-51]|uniref:hypothetical protein n=1 Tax=Yimella sp. cx-51 TaxID=2770551 RepID=UPI00165DE0A4|nr:hypothetical protein [Yimella sp. cx-51]MBC9955859.1 hypothetical protein [Yimella sp. cx-51]QTH37595.1 hypothetical protein J5M86_12050 [Yimella sp. cx-51]
MNTVRRSWPRLLLWLPALVMVGLAERANRWMPHDTIFGRAVECAIDGECFTPATAAHVDAMAWQFALCALLVCVGAVLSGRTLDDDRRGTGRLSGHLSAGSGVLAGLLGFVTGDGGRVRPVDVALRDGRVGATGSARSS